MGIILNTPMSEIDDYIEESINRSLEALAYNLMYVGERCLNAAKSSNAYRDQTGNLRSSLGYVIAYDGQIVYQSSFKAVKEGQTGAENGIRYAKEIVQQYPDSVVFVMVAGMKYAAYVAATGRDVLDSAKLLADKFIPQIFNLLGFGK